MNGPQLNLHCTLPPWFDLHVVPALPGWLDHPHTWPALPRSLSWTSSGHFPWAEAALHWGQTVGTAARLPGVESHFFHCVSLGDLPLCASVFSSEKWGYRQNLVGLFRGVAALIRVQYFEDRVWHTVRVFRPIYKL